MSFSRIALINPRTTYTSEHNFQTKLKQMPVFQLLLLSISALIMGRFRQFGHVRPLPLSSSRQQGITGQVVGHVTQADLGPDPDETDPAHYCAAGAHRYHAKDMLDATAHPGSAPVALLLPGRQFLMPTALALQMLTKALLLKFLQRFFGAIGGVRPDISAGIVRIKQHGKHLTVVHTGIGHRVAADKLVVRIDTDMILVAKKRFTVLLRPAGVYVFLSPFTLAPG